MESSNLETILGVNTKVKGDLFFKGPAEIDAEVEGEIKGESLITIRENAKLKSNISSAKIVIYGDVVGNITATEKVSLKRTAKLQGNIETPCIEVEDGATFNGSCIMKHQDLKSQTNMVRE